MNRYGSLRVAVAAVGNVTVPEFFPSSSCVCVFHFGFGLVTRVVGVDVAGGGWVVGHVVVFVPARVLYGRAGMRLWTRTVPDRQSKQAAVLQPFVLNRQGVVKSAGKGVFLR